MLNRFNPALPRHRGFLFYDSLTRNIMKLIYLIGISLLLSLPACAPKSTDFQQTLYVFGTMVDITLHDTTRAQADAAVEELEQTFQRMHRDWHAWQPGGELYDLNVAIAKGGSSTISDFTMPLLVLSKQLSRQSGGRFNPAIGRLIALWGFHQDEPPTGAVPDKAQIAQLVERHPGMDDLVIDGHNVSSRNDSVNLDFGAFAKGYALNMAIDQLAGHGIHNAIVNAGGDLCVSGRHDNRPWRIGIRHPQGQGIIAAVNVSDGECVMTSGNYERYREDKGIRYAHIIDPRDGMPVREIVSSTVIDTNGGRADAAATALSVAGVKDWYKVAHDMQLKYVMLVDETGRVYMNPAMADRVEFENDTVLTTISEPL
jgi:thiamine biosynthesis lipoprotein